MDPVLKVCWLTDSDRHSVRCKHANSGWSKSNGPQRLIWQITTQLMWIVLAEFITMMCAAITILHLYRHKVCSGAPHPIRKKD
jgi:hypothetical protein